MAKNYRHSGQTRNITPTADVVSGQVVDLGNGKVGIALTDIAANVKGTVKIAGVFRFNAAAHGLAQGAAVSMTLATQVIGAGVAIGEVDEVVDNDNIDVLLNGLPASG